MNRMGILVAAGVVAMGALGGCGGGASTAPGSSSGGASAGSAPAPAVPSIRTITVTVRSGKASGDVGRIQLPLGTPVLLAVSSDVADELHVHGYDRKAKIPAGATGSVAFTANTPGVFEVELENSKLALLQLQVG
jgi:hypothetical protein